MTETLSKISQLAQYHLAFRIIGTLYFSGKCGEEIVARHYTWEEVTKYSSSCEKPLVQSPAKNDRQRLPTSCIRLSSLHFLSHPPYFRHTETNASESRSRRQYQTILLLALCNGRLAGWDHLRLASKPRSLSLFTSPPSPED
ncbi:hypothetical protein Pmani_025855 [Petrolisthes manimaculis]|uniref:Uncharacterized protein n=1 Tax=Petrolisthes manimaculis TaxID=1843537 RepID=A0AAE1P748_9EUCA|nr:hypothetical protein Pmani_025855 [Petrolisthes manimaculis]